MKQRKGLTVLSILGAFCKTVGLHWSVIGLEKQVVSSFCFLSGRLRQVFCTPPSVFRARRLGEIILHSKQILLLVVVVNLLDCCLVLGELILDIHYIKGNIIHSVAINQMSFSIMWYVRPAKAQTSLLIRAVWSEHLLVAWIFYDC